VSTAPETKAKAKAAPAAKTAKPAAKAAKADTSSQAQDAGAPAKSAAAKSTAAGNGAAKRARPSRPVAAKKRVRAPARTTPSESRLAQVLVAPIVSEKATMAADKHNQVLFKVLRDATKPEIKAAVELMFKVTVDSVQTVQHKGKTKRFAKGVGRRDHVKKAYVCLAEGQELNFSGEAA
jgi:large subunit ribosomal protein L23